MGIQNLLRFLKPFIEPIHIKKFSGKRVGIDAYSWLHKGAYSCSMELCLGSRTEAARRYLKYFMHHVNLLRHFGVTPVVVFDGGSIPCKLATEQERHKRREANMALAKEKLKQGNVKEAIEFFKRAVRITPAMAHQLIQVLRSENVEFLVAPYEADAQLAYLSTLDTDKGGIEAVITEDSDLIAYGCQAIIFKMDRYGNGEEFVLDKIFNSVSDGLSFRNFDKELFTGMCVLAGCDFLPSIVGIGTKRAYSLVSKYRNLDRVLSALKLDKHYQIPEDYPESFRKAVAVFHHARIYDAENKALKPMKPLEQEQEQVESMYADTDFLGPELSPSVAVAIAEGHLNPSTMEAYDPFPRTENSSDHIGMRTFDYFDEDVDNCINIFPAKQHRSDEISYRDEIQVTSTRESCITVFSAQKDSKEELTCTTVTRQIISDQEKYKKEALALGKLIAPSQCNMKIKLQLEKREVPNNNPFKRRKMTNDNDMWKENLVEQVTEVTDVGNSVDILWSASPGSQESVVSKPAKKASEKGKVKNTKKSSSKDDHKALKNEKCGILKFLQRL